MLYVDGLSHIFHINSTSLIMGYIIYYAQLYFIKYTFVSKEERQKKPSQQHFKKLVTELAAVFSCISSCMVIAV